MAEPQNLPDISSDSLPEATPEATPVATQVATPEATPQVPIPSSESNESSLQKIEEDLNTLLSFVTKNEALVDNLELQLKQNKTKIEELENEIVKSKTEKETAMQEYQQNAQKQSEINEQLQKTLGDSESIKMELENCKRKEKELLEQIKQAEIRENALKEEKDKTKLAIQRIQEKINTINEKVRMQTTQLDTLGSSMGQTGAGKKNPFMVIRNKMKVVALNRKLNRASRKKLDALGNAWKISPSRFTQKEDLRRALKIILHCKLGLVKRKTHLKTVAKNMNILEKSGKDICEILLKNMSKISIKKAHEILI